MQHSNIFLSVDHIRINVFKMGCQHFTINTILDKDESCQKIPNDYLFISYNKKKTKNTRFYQNLYRFPKVPSIFEGGLPSLSGKHFISRKPQITFAPPFSPFKNMLNETILFLGKKDFHPWKYHKTKWAYRMI